MLLGGVLVVLAALAVAAYLAVTGLRARHDLEQARTAVANVKTAVLDGNNAAARDQLRVAAAGARAAVHQTSGPLWSGVAAIPWLGSPIDTVRGLTDAAHRLTRDVLPEVVRAADALSPDRVRVAGNRINVAVLSREAPTLDRASAATASVVGAVAALPHHTWLGAADDARTQLNDVLAGFGTTLRRAATAARLLPPMLGANGPRNYLVVFENEAESRGLGGLPGAYAILHGSHGRISFTRFGNDSDITAKVRLPLGRDFAARYVPMGAEDVFANTDMSPHFPYAARVWLAMWQEQTGQRLDGAVVTDPQAFAYLLAVTGPVTLPSGLVISADNVVTLTQNTVYAKVPDPAAQNAFFVAVAKASAKHVLSSGLGQGRQLLDAMQRAVVERRLLLWSAHPREQTVLTATPLSGVLPSARSPFTAVVVNNAAGDKLDYYLDRTLFYTPGSCSGSRRVATAAVTLTNTAPRQGLPAYVSTRADLGAKGPPGTDRVLLSLYATRGAQLSAVRLDGHASTASVESERGHPVYSVDLTLRPGQSRTVVFRLDEPRLAGPVTTLTQPLVRPLQASISEPFC